MSPAVWANDAKLANLLITQQEEARRHIRVGLQGVEIIDPDTHRQDVCEATAKVGSSWRRRAHSAVKDRAQAQGQPIDYRKQCLARPK